MTATQWCFYSNVVQSPTRDQKPAVPGWVLCPVGITATEKFRNGKRSIKVYCYPGTDKTKLWNTQHTWLKLP